jgi:tRNA 2-thiouridine synthesizing protein B
MKRILHTVNKSPFSSTLLKQCVERCQTEDSILLLEDGVYGALASHAYSHQLMNINHCYAIKADIMARGLQNEVLLNHIEWISYDDFVTLSIEHELLQSWY